MAEEIAEPRGEYRIYGELEAYASAMLASVLLAKGLPARFIEQTPSLSLVLAARAGREEGPYLRTPEGFVLGGLHEILGWIERSHPEPSLMPRTPVRTVCTLMLEDWIEFWLSQSGELEAEVNVLGEHLARSRFFLGATPVRADWLLGAWLETECLTKAHGRAALQAQQLAPSEALSSFATGLLATRSTDWAELASAEEAVEDVIPISLLAILERMAGGYHEFLCANQRALKDRVGEVVLDLGAGPIAFPMSTEAEARRTEVAEIVRALPAEEQASVRRILEPVGAWAVLVLPPVLEPIDASDPRSL